MEILSLNHSEIKNSSDLILQSNSVSDPTFQNEGRDTDPVPPENEFCSAGKSVLWGYPGRDITRQQTTLKDLAECPQRDSLGLIQCLDVSL